MTKQNKKKSTPNKITKEIAALMTDKKALDIMIIDVKGITTLTDYFIICTSESDPQTKAIANHIKDTLFEKENIKSWHTEGYQHLNWVLIDFVDIVVNIFNKESREYYDIERLWGDAKIEPIKESLNNE